MKKQLIYLILMFSTVAGYSQTPLPGNTVTKTLYTDTLTGIKISSFPYTIDKSIHVRDTFVFGDGSKLWSTLGLTPDSTIFVTYYGLGRYIDSIGLNNIDLQYVLDNGSYAASNITIAGEMNSGQVLTSTVQAGVGTITVIVNKYLSGDSALFIGQVRGQRAVNNDAFVTLAQMQDSAKTLQQVTNKGNITTKSIFAGDTLKSQKSISDSLYTDVIKGKTDSNKVSIMANVGIGKKVLSDSFKLDVLGYSRFFNPSTSVAMVSGRFSTGIGGGILLGSYDGTYGGIWSNVATPSQFNYGMRIGAALSELNNGTEVRMSIGGSPKITLSGTTTTFSSANTIILGNIPTTSAGSYDILTRNSSTGAQEKITTTDIVNLSKSRGIRTTTDTTTITYADYTILVDATSGNKSIFLPIASSVSGLVFVVKKIDASANDVVIDPNGTQVIDGALTRTFNTQYSGVTFQSNGTAWYIISTF